MIASLNQSSSLSSFGAALMSGTTSMARPSRETAEQQRRILRLTDAQTNSAPLYIKKRAKQVRQQMAAIVAAGASLLGSQRSRRPRPSRSFRIGGDPVKAGLVGRFSRPRRRCDGRRHRQSVCIAARWACWWQKQVSIVPQFESAALDRGCRTAPVGRNREQISPWPFRTREIYRSANGDRWLLACDSDTAWVFVRHERSDIAHFELLASHVDTATSQVDGNKR